MTFFKPSKSIFAFISFLLFIGLSPAFTQNGWDLKLNKDGIKVYTKLEPGSSFDAFKGIGELPASVDEVANFLNTVSEYTKVFPDNSEAREIKRVNENTFFFYSRTKAPWPVDDRDGVYESVKKVNTDGSIIITLTSKHTMVQRYDGVVRIEKALSYWRLYPLPNGTTKIEYEVHTNPGGSIPEWLANSTVTDMPYKTILNMRNYFLKK